VLACATPVPGRSLHSPSVSVVHHNVTSYRHRVGVYISRLSMLRWQLQVSPCTGVYPRTTYVCCPGQLPAKAKTFARHVMTLAIQVQCAAHAAWWWLWGTILNLMVLGLPATSRVDCVAWCLCCDAAQNAIGPTVVNFRVLCGAFYTFLVYWESKKVRLMFGNADLFINVLLVF